MGDKSRIGMLKKRIREKYTSPKADADLKEVRARVEKANAHLRVKVTENDLFLAEEECKAATKRYNSQMDDLYRVSRSQSLSDNEVRVLSLYCDKENSQQLDLPGEELFDPQRHFSSLDDRIAKAQSSILSFPWKDKLVEQLVDICCTSDLDQRNRKENGGESKIVGWMDSRLFFSEPQGKEIDTDLQELNNLVKSKAGTILDYLSAIFYRTMDEATYTGLLDGRIGPIAELYRKRRAIEEKFDAPRLNEQTPSDGELMLARILSNCRDYMSPNGRIRAKEIADVMNQLSGERDYRAGTQVTQWLKVRGYKERYAKIRERYFPRKEASD